MAAADVLKITDQTTTLFGDAHAFLSTDKATIPATLNGAITASSNNANGSGGVAANGAAATVEMDRFPLAEDSFVNLQIDLRAAMKLPKDEAAFKLSYPESLFETYTKKDKKMPGLYPVSNAQCGSFSTTRSNV